jgi:hypothetical protein
MKKNIYKWHRTLSLIIALPVMLWAISGFMHPIMTTIRPQVTTQSLEYLPLDSSKIKMSLKNVLLKNQIKSIVNFRLVHIDTNWFYQVQVNKIKQPVYFSTENGNILSKGDWLYAQHLAKQFMEGGQQKGKLGNNSTLLPSQPQVLHDCCDAATSTVLNAKGSKVINASVVADFNNEYKGINRLLPVYKVAFDRPDGIRIYVETTQDRFAFAMDNKRALLDKIFRLVHTWGWLDYMGKGKFIIEFVLAFTAFGTTLLGVYIFFSSKSKRVKDNRMSKARRNHRFTAIVVALFTLMFTFSGGFHALSKLTETASASSEPISNTDFPAATVNVDLSRIRSAVRKPVFNISLAVINAKTYFRVITEAGGSKNKDLMKDMSVSPTEPVYVNTIDFSILGDGDRLYAKSLASQFNAYPENEIHSASLITKFNDEYNFTDKRLPVWKVSYTRNSNERFYVETATRTLAKRTNDTQMVEGFSFALLHKHHFMDWGGKGLRDFSTMFWAVSQIVMVAVGLILYVKSRRRRAKNVLLPEVNS